MQRVRCGRLAGSVLASFGVDFAVSHRVVSQVQDRRRPANRGDSRISKELHTLGAALRARVPDQPDRVLICVAVAHPPS
jgi:hypothetical protein